MNKPVNGSSALMFKAGPAAFRRIRGEGFDIRRIGSVLGASGGAKWLVLSQIDRVVVTRLLPAIDRPLYLLGSSIGAWRFACYAQSDPLAALERFEYAYLEQSYSENPDVVEITRKSREILAELLGDHGVGEILSHPLLRSNVLTVRARHLTASDSRPVLALGLLMAMTANVVHRRALGAFFARGLFFDPRGESPFMSATGFPLHKVPLTEQNFAEAVIASGSIPMLLEGVRDIPGAPRGTYRDGGVIDYHLDVPNVVDDRITLYPHFFDWLKPGWFDRQLSWRRVTRGYFDNTLLICPRREFISSLPEGKVPDRTDFVRLNPARRKRIWRDVVRDCGRLADELNDVLDKDALPARLEPLW